MPTPPVGGGLGIFTVKMHTIKWGWAYLRKKITVNMPPLKSSLIKPSKSMLFFHIWNANFSVTPINSQMYMTKPKQVQKKLSENTGKTFSVIMPSFTCRGWAYLRKLLYTDVHRPTLMCTDEHLPGQQVKPIDQRHQSQRARAPAWTKPRHLFKI